MLLVGCSSHSHPNPVVSALCSKITADDDSTAVFNNVRAGTQTPTVGASLLDAASAALENDATQAQTDGFAGISAASRDLSLEVAELAAAVQAQDPNAETDDSTKIAVTTQQLMTACSQDGGG